VGIESDQVVYEYLSRVGDVAQQRQLPSSTRMRLVSHLRDEIDRHRARTAVDSPAAVRRILDRLGTPDEVVEAAGGTEAAPQPPVTAVPVQREPEPEERPKGLRRVVPRPRPAEPERPAPRAGASPPHLAAAHELGDSAARPDWMGVPPVERIRDWGRVEDSPFGTAAGDAIPGFVGGVEIPDLLKRPPKDPVEAERPASEEPTKAKEAKEAKERAELVPAPARRRLPFPRPAAGWTNPLLLLAAAALVAGAVLGNWFALLLGWLIAYGSRRLTPAETKWAVLVLPGSAAVAGLVWLWGRNTGRWGDPIAQGHLNDALTQTWPWVVRGAAVASALYLVWRSQRTR